MSVTAIDHPSNTLTPAEIGFANQTPVKQLVAAVSTPNRTKAEHLRVDGVPNYSSIGVDRERAILKGYVVAEEGPFKTLGRGSFDQQSLQVIQRLMLENPEGIPVHFQHPSLVDDGLGKVLGRLQNPRLSDVVRPNKSRAKAVRADLKFCDAALTMSLTGGTPPAEYIMSLAESDPGLLSSSLVLAADQEMQRDSRGKLKLGADGNPLPPVWRPTAIYGSDIVSRGEAVGALLSVPTMPATKPPNRTSTAPRRLTLAQARAILDRTKAGMAGSHRGSVDRHVNSVIELSRRADELQDRRSQMQHTLSCAAMFCRANQFRLERFGFSDVLAELRSEVSKGVDGANAATVNRLLSTASAGLWQFGIRL